MLERILAIERILNGQPQSTPKITSRLEKEGIVDAIVIAPPQDEEE